MMVCCYFVTFCRLNPLSLMEMVLLVITQIEGSRCTPLSSCNPCMSFFLSVASDPTERVEFLEAILEKVRNVCVCVCFFFLFADVH